MKIIFCTDILLATLCTEKLDVELAHKWQSIRTDKFSELADKAIPEGASYIAVFGDLFGQERISEGVIDSFFKTVNDQKHISFLAFLNQAEYSRISYRNDIPDNLHMICTQISDMYTDDNVAIQIKDHQAHIQLGDNDEIIVSKTAEKYQISGLKDGEKIIPRFEATGYDDSTEYYGYSVLEWTDSSIDVYKEIEDKKFSYQTTEIKLSPEDNQKEIVKKLIQASSKFAYETFLRINFVGRTDFGFLINIDEIESQLQSKVFFVEVYDNTVMDIDEESFENDISLRSEFVRLALQDDSLSEAERNRILSCGWNVLNGKEVSAQ
jgi:hypothetical protein